MVNWEKLKKTHTHIKAYLLNPEQEASQIKQFSELCPNVPHEDLGQKLPLYPMEHLDDSDLLPIWRLDYLENILF